MTNILVSAERTRRALDAAGLIVKEAEVAVYVAGQPATVGDLAAAEVLTGEHHAEIDLTAAESQPPAMRAGDDLVVKWILLRWQSLIRAR